MHQYSNIFRFFDRLRAVLPDGSFFALRSDFAADSLIVYPFATVPLSVTSRNLKL